ncbi:hypothetical protein V8B97DRAFT_1057266 [Scleroderma yunnanense]
MGIFKKFLSIGSRKSKKRCIPQPSQAAPPSTLNVLQEEEAEEAVSRLLRSSSARFAAEPEVDFSSLPPLPHPIDTVVSTPAATITSVSQRSNYSVTVHGRTVHSRTEFPNAYPPMDKIFTPKRSLTDSARRRSKSVPITPRDQNRLLNLRQDPSVANLLNHYDDKGCLDSGIFSNTPPPPPRDGRVQRRRTGSTLRQLLGHPSSPELRDTSADISWADKFLGESDENSSVSSGLPTPADTRFTDPRLGQADLSILSIECESAVYHRTFSSLEVELSVSTDQAHHEVHDHMTPQKASEIFGFLAERKKVPEPSLPSRLPQLKPTLHFSPEPLHVDTSRFDIPRRNSAHIPRTVSPPSHRRSSTISSPMKMNPTASIQLQLRDDAHKYTKPLPVVTEHDTGQSGRGPRGPRAPPKSALRFMNRTDVVLAQTGDIPVPTNHECATTRLAFNEKSNAKAVYPSPARTPAGKSHIPKLRSASGSTIKSVDSKKDSEGPKVDYCTSQATTHVTAQPTPKATPHLSLTANEIPSNDKENNIMTRLPQPVTPVRPLGFRPPYIIEPPSPASSTELSPVAKQMMANLRQQRMLARQKDRQTSRLGSSQSRIRY